MQTIKYFLVIISVFFFMSSCKKELSLEQHRTDEDVALDLKNLVSANKFQLRAFYSDIPLDFVENDDVVKQETDLWGYVSGHLKDDVNTFDDNGTDVRIEQNQMKKPGLNDPVLERKYFIGTDSAGVYMKFLDSDYNPLKYRLYEVYNSYFILSLPWKHGATLFSRFERL